MLEDFLYLAIFVSPGGVLPSRNVIYLPEIFIYVDSFGMPGDSCVIAEQAGKIIGAAWTRLIRAYGHINDKIPELAISVLPEYRGQGSGTLLMSRLFSLMQYRGYKQTSLIRPKRKPCRAVLSSAGI